MEGYPQGIFISERVSDVVSQVGDLDSLRLCRVHSDEFHGQEIFVRERRSRDITKPLRKVVSADPITAKNAVHPNTMVQIISTSRPSDEICVSIRVLAFDRKDFRPSQSFKVETDLVEMACEVGSE